MNVNVLYLTNQCNLHCPYCYEQQGKEREKRIINYEEIDKYLNTLIEVEKSNNSTLCLMGGEPLLEMKKIMYIYNFCEKTAQTLGKNIAINIISNGTLIKKNLSNLKKILTSNSVHVSLDVSYDGSYQNVRTPNSTIVQDNLNLLNSLDIPFGLSFTITTKTVKTSLEEIVTMLELFYPNKDKNLIHNNKKKIRVNYDYQGLMDEIGREELSKVKQQLTKTS